MPFFYAHLVVRRGKVNGTEYSGLTKLVEKVMDTRYRKHVQMHLLIQTTEINTHAKLTGLFAYEEDRCTIWWYAGSNPTLCQHIIDMLLYNFQLIRRKMVLLMSRRCRVFVHQIDRVIQRSMWGKSRCLKNILKLIAKGRKTRIYLFLPLRLFLPIAWSNKSYPTDCIRLGFQSCMPVLSRNQFGANWLRHHAATNNDTTIQAVCVLHTCMQTVSSTRVIKTQLWVNPIDTWIVLV